MEGPVLGPKGRCPDLRWCECRSDRACSLVGQWAPNKPCAREGFAREVEVKCCCSTQDGWPGYQGGLLRGSSIGAGSLLICSTLSVTGPPVPNWVKCSLIERQSCRSENQTRTSSGKASVARLGYLWNLTWSA